jgi:hypothetical protein
MAGEVPDGQDLLVLAIDHLRRLTVVHRPDGSRPMPLKSISFALVTMTPYSPIAAEKIRQDTSLLVGKEGS